MLKRECKTCKTSLDDKFMSASLEFVGFCSCIRLRVAHIFHRPGLGPEEMHVCLSRSIAARHPCDQDISGLVASTPLVEELQHASRMNKKKERHENLYQEPKLSRKCTANLLPCGSARIFDLCNANKLWIGMANSAVGMLEACQWQNMRGYQREVKLPTCENR